MKQWSHLLLITWLAISSGSVIGQTDETANPTALSPTEEMPKVASIYMANTDEGLLVEINGFLPGLVDKMFFDGMDVTDLVASMIDQGKASLTETSDQLSLLVDLPEPILGEHTFGFSSPQGLLVSKKFVLQELSTEKITSVKQLSGTAKYKTGWWGTQKISSQKIRVIYRLVIGGKINDRVFYPVEVTTSNDGMYDVSCQLKPESGLAATTRETCYEANVVYFRYGSYCLGPINLNSEALYYGRYDPVMVDCTIYF